MRIAPKRIVSLNRQGRKERMQQIAKDNQLMLERLVKGKSCFSVEKWQKQEKSR